MKKIVCIVFLLSSACYLKAQELEIAKAFIFGNQFDKGKEAIDKFLAKPANANNAEGWYYKAVVYGAASRTGNKSFAEANAMNRESFNALTKYKQLDPKEKFTKEEKNNTIFYEYSSFYDFAIRAYNAKFYDTSYANFKDALELHDYIYTNKLVDSKGIMVPALDTDIVWNMAVLGNELKKKDEVQASYKRLVDADLKDQKYTEAYEAVVQHYQKAKDQAHFDEYLAKGKANFPTDPYWEEIDMVNSTDGATGDALFKKYDELGTKYPSSYTVWFYYANDLNRYVYSDDSKNVDVTAYKKKIPEIGKKALAINNTPDANMLLANFYYNNSFDLGEASGKIKGAKPDDVKKKTELITASKRSLDDCLPYAMAAADAYGKQAKLKSAEKSNYRLACDMLSEIYRVKQDPKKAAEYKAKKETIM